jgi:hypothetical protein
LTINEAMSTNFANLKVGAETKFVMGHNSKDSVRISSPTGEPKIGERDYDTFMTLAELCQPASKIETA